MAPIAPSGAQILLVLGSEKGSLSWSPLSIIDSQTDPRPSCEMCLPVGDKA